MKKKLFPQLWRNPILILLIVSKTPCFIDHSGLQSFNVNLELSISITIPFFQILIIMDFVISCQKVGEDPSYSPEIHYWCLAVDQSLELLYNDLTCLFAMKILIGQAEYSVGLCHLIFFFSGSSLTWRKESITHFSEILGFFLGDSIFFGVHFFKLILSKIGLIKLSPYGLKIKFMMLSMFSGTSCW